MDVLGKLASSAQGFWWSLDEHERRTVIYVTAYVLVTVLAGVHSMTRERHDAKMRAEIVAELRGA